MSATIQGVDTNLLMRFDPAFGTEKPYPSHAQQYRDYHGRMAWLFNPWTGHKRHPADIGSDPLGVLVSPRDAKTDGPLINQASTVR